MAQVETIPGGNYATLAQWESGEQNSDYGAGNPATAQITGTIAKENITGAWPRGFIIESVPGEEPVFRGGAGTAILSGASMILIPSTVNTAHEVRNLEVDSLDVRTSDATISTTATGCKWRNAAPNFARNANCVFTAKFCESPDGVTRGYDATSGATATAINCTIVGVASGNFGFVRWSPTNCFVYADAGTGYAAATGGDYNASDDTSSPGANSLDNRTTADFADFAGGDYRTASASALATAGDGVNEDFIGAALETAGGVTVEVPSGTISLAGQAPTVTAPNPIAVEIPVGSISLAGQIPTVIADGSVDVEIPVGTISLIGQAPTVTADGSLSIEVPIGSISLVGFAPVVTADGSIQVEVPVGAISLTGYAPQVVAGNGVNIEIPAGALSITGFAPQVIAPNPVSVEVPPGLISINGFAPDVLVGGPVTISPDTGEIILTGYAPVVFKGLEKAPLIRTLVIRDENRTLTIPFESRTLKV